MKLSTINQVVESILGLEDTCIKSKPGEDWGTITKYLANEAAIHWKTFAIAEDKSIDEAMKYFTGCHSEDEYQEFRTSVVAIDGSKRSKI